MHICFVVISDGWGGAESVVYQIISNMVKKDINISIILNDEMKKYFKDLDIKMLNLGSLYDSQSLIKMIIQNKSMITLNSKPLPILNMILMYTYFYRARKRIKKFLKDVDIIHSHLEYSDLMSYVVKKGSNNEFRWVTTIHGPWFSLFYDESRISSLKNIIFVRLLKNSFMKSNKITFVSKYLYNGSKKSFGELVNEKGLVIHNGVNISKFKDLGTVKLEDGFNILFPGGPKLIKGGDILIKAINQLVNKIDNLTLYVALEVPKDHLLRKLVQEYNLEEKVRFLGFLDVTKFKTVLNSVDVLAMPSRYEGFPMVFLEAMALGIPMVASNVGGVPEIIKDQRNGILTSLEPQNVADAIYKLYIDENLRKKMSENNLTDIHQFEWKKILDEYVDIYNSII